MRHFPLDAILISYTHFSRMLRVFRGLTAYGLGGVVIAIVLPIVIFFNPNAMAALVYSFADIFLDVDYRVLESVKIPPTSKLPIDAIIVYFLVFCLGATILSIFMFYIVFYIFRKISNCSKAFSYVAISIIILTILFLISMRVYSYVTLSKTYHFENLLYFMFCGFAVALIFPVVWLLVRGLVQILGNNSEFVRFFFTPHERSAAFLLRPSRLSEELYRAVGIAFPPEGGGKKYAITCACLFAVACEGIAYSLYTSLGNQLIGSAELFSITQVRAAFGFVGTNADFAAFLASASLFSLLFGRFLLWGSRRLRRLALRRSVVFANEAQTRDVRPPILFLRAFRDDQVSLKSAHTAKVIRFFDPDVEVGNLEELVVSNLTEYGPVVALGNPSDEMPPVGAAREYARDGDWRASVEALMEAAAFIVVALDFSPNVRWEIETIRNRSWLSKTLILLPPHLSHDGQDAEDIYETMGVRRDQGTWELATKLFPKYLSELPEKLRSLKTQERHVIGFLWPGEDVPIAITSHRSSVQEYELALRAGIKSTMLKGREA